MTTDTQLNKDETTTEPVTTGGWYALNTGRWAHFYWLDGRLLVDAVAADWADVSKQSRAAYDTLFGAVTA